MLKIIKHRQNKIKDLDGANRGWGVEVDLRSDPAFPKKLYLAHEPWVPGDSFADWLAVYAQKKIAGPLILNTKEDGLEEVILAHLRHQKISSYFFLDTTYPTLINYTIQKKNPHFSLRLSSFEKSNNIQVLVGKAEWLWVDCFAGVPLPLPDVKRWKENFKICLVSPELQGQSTEKISNFSELVSLADAVCTKEPSLWANP